MELHHHSNLTPGFKGWKSFLWEFLMLFFAVFAASLAEYQLEHKIERDRETQYIQSMIVDLAADTTNLAKAIRSYNKYELRLDTTLTRINLLLDNFNDTLLRNITLSYVDFINTDRTMQQLKNSGAMRLIRKQSVADSILDYDLEMKHLMNTSQPILQNLVLSKIMPLFYKMMDFNRLNYAINHESIEQLRREYKSLIICKDRSMLVELSNYLMSYKGTCVSIREDQEKLKAQATKLIKLLKKEYKLE